MSVQLLLHWFWVLVGCGLIAGILWWIVGKAPVIPQPVKEVIQWVILAACGMLVIYLILVPMITGGSVGGLRP